MDITEIKKLAEQKADVCELRGTEMWNGIYFGYIYGYQACQEAYKKANKHDIIRNEQTFCVVCGNQYKNPNNDSDTCYNCRETHAR